ASRTRYSRPTGAQRKSTGRSPRTTPAAVPRSCAACAASSVARAERSRFCPASCLVLFCHVVVVRQVQADAHQAARQFMADAMRIVENLDLGRMLLRDLAHDCQPEPAAFDVRTQDAIEAVEDMDMLAGRNAGAGVLHLEHGALPDRIHAHAHRGMA